ncbi:MAG: precorrin-2 dehydrogenase [Deltaproteobacteria bacterium]|nr:MAG: precorrin-2 dehydrogenase [Deltaproteobacteria bacterium]
MRYYPVGLDIRGKRCVVIGGGGVAERRVKRLLECKARVLVISPCVTPYLKRLIDRGRIEYIPRKYREGDLVGAYIVIASTDDPEVNSSVAKEARELGILTNTTTSRELCDFIVPSVVRRGKIVVTVSTEGRSPALSQELRARLEKTLGKEYEVFSRILEALRKKLRSMPYPLRTRLFRELVVSDIPELLRKKRLKEAENRFRQITGLDFKKIGVDLNLIYS